MRSLLLVLVATFIGCSAPQMSIPASQQAISPYTLDQDGGGYVACTPFCAPRTIKTIRASTVSCAGDLR